MELFERRIITKKEMYHQDLVVKKMIYELWEDRKSKIKKIRIKDRIDIIDYKDKRLKWLLKK